MIIESSLIQAHGNSWEWLEPDGLGGYASGTVSGVRTRRYHALLLTATRPPTGRMVLVNGFDAWLEIEGRILFLSSQCYEPGVTVPENRAPIESFDFEPWPRWIYKISDANRIVHECFVPHETSAVALSWRWEGEAIPGARLCVRPFFSGRDFHSLQRENPAFCFEPKASKSGWEWNPYPGVPSTVIRTNAEYHHEPVWYRHFIYEQERLRGLDCVEDLAAPGVFRFKQGESQAVMIFASGGIGESVESGEDLYRQWRESERNRRAAFPSLLHRAADAYVVRRGQGRTVIAGYPWFGDWGRDTFISLRGIGLATERFQETGEILLEWSVLVSEGMLPNRFPDESDQPEYNSVDASLWYVIVVGEFLEAIDKKGIEFPDQNRERLLSAVEAILQGYSQGTRYGIRMDGDHLLACGEPGVQLTWMDAKVGDWVVTPRIGKPVEIQALWINALWTGSRWNQNWKPIFTRAHAAFRERFWNRERNCLYDVIDCSHEQGAVDPSFRPNQIFAVGGLPLNLLEPEQARQVVTAIHEQLWTPLGLRSLAPGEKGYAPHYEGGVRQRDGSYHQGTVWPWLAGPFIEAWIRVYGETSLASARETFLQPLLDGLKMAGLGHLPEIADAESPHTPRGCPFQAWSLGELLRLQKRVLKG